MRHLLEDVRSGATPVDAALDRMRHLPYEDLVPYYFQRHTARPGITGLAQVSGCRGSTAESGPAISRIDYDLHYIERWSLRMDITIIIRTIRKEFLSGSGF